MHHPTQTVLNGVSRGFIAPSILSARFDRLGEEVMLADQAGADLLHVDVMDGHFVPNLTIGPLVVKAIRPLTKLPLDCHLMVSDPQKWIEYFAHAGADIITIHAEVALQPQKLLRKIRKLGCLAGISINPATPLHKIENLLDKVDLVLLMSVNPGFGGQKFIESTLKKIKKLAEIRKNRSFVIEVDGGIKADNAGRIRAQGCDIFVAGSAIFSKSDYKIALLEIKNAIQKVKTEES